MREKSYKNVNNSQPNNIRGGETKVMKKFINALLAFVLVFAMAVPAFAAEDSAQAEAATRLQNLDILKGYEDGSLGLDKDITRAEFAAVAVRLLGLESAAELSKASTAFSDVAASHWASGYVNIAVQQGIIKGYPDGTFKPSQNVSGVEALAMLVRILGYDPAVTGVWPSNYIVKANEIGLTKKAPAFSATAPAPRGLVAQFADNALTIDKMIQTTTGTEVTYAVKEGKTLLSENLSSKKVEGKVLDSGLLIGSSLDDDEVTISVAAVNGDDKHSDVGKDLPFTLINGASAFPYLGMDVIVWSNDDDEIFLVQLDDSALLSDLVTANANTDTTNHKGLEVTLDSADKTYDVLDDALLIVGGVVKDPVDFLDPNHDGTLDDTLVNFNVKYSLNSKNKIDTLIASYYGSAKMSIVEEVKVKSDKVEIRDKSSFNNNVTIDEDDEYLILDGNTGAVLTFDDLKENDIIYTADNGTEFIIMVSKKTVEGEFDKVKEADKYVYIDGVKYRPIDKQLTSLSFSVDGGDEFDANLDDVLGQDVVAGIGLDGRVVYMSATDATEISPANYFFAYGAKEDVGLTSTKYYLLVYNQDGDKVAYQVTDDTDYEVGATKGNIDDNRGGIDLADFDYLFETTAEYDVDALYDITVDGTNGLALVDLDLTDDGKVSKLTIIPTTKLADKANTAFVDATSSRVKVNATDWYSFADNAVVVDADDTTYTSVNGTVQVSDIDANEHYFYYHLNSDSEIDVLFVGDDVATSAGNYAVLVDAYKTSSKNMAEILYEDGKTLTLENGVTGKVYTDRIGFLFEVTVDGSKLTAAADPEAILTDSKGDGTADDVFVVITKVSGDRLYLEDETETALPSIYLADDVVVFDVSDEFEVVDASDIGKGYYVVSYVTNSDGEVTHIVIADDVDDVK